MPSSASTGNRPPTPEQQSKTEVDDDDKPKTEVDDDKSKPSFENVLEALGVLGRYQRTQLALTFLANIIVAQMQLSFVFLGYTPPHVCNKVNETSLLIDKGLDSFDFPAEVKVEYKDECTINIMLLSSTTNGSDRSGARQTIGKSSSCLEGRNFYTTNGTPTTYVSEWDLVCESAAIAEWSQMIFVVGQVIGGFVMSQLIDLIGRKTVFVISTTAVFIFEGLVLVVPNIYVIYGTKFLSGFFFLGVYASYVVFGMELLMPRHRDIYGVTITLFCGLYSVVMGGIAYLLQDVSWRYLQGILAASGAGCILYPFVMTESPRWLAANGQREKALAIIEKACKQNKKDFTKVKKSFEAFMFAEYGIKINEPSPLTALPDNENHMSYTVDAKWDADISHSGDGTLTSQNTSGMKTKESVLTLFRTKRLFFLTLIVAYISVTCEITYIGLFMTSSSIAGDRFLNFFLMALVEIPSNFTILFALRHMSRRFVLMTFLALSAISLMTSSLVVTFVDGFEFVPTVLFIIGKFAITGACNILLIYAPEIFPTNLRGVGTGLCNGLGRGGTSIAPFLRPLYNKMPWAPGLIFTVMCAISVVLIPLLPETKDKNLPNNVNDLKNKKTAKTKRGEYLRLL